MNIVDEESREDLVFVAKDLNNILGLSPAIDTVKSSTETILQRVKEAVGLLEEGDVLDSESVEILDYLKIEIPDGVKVAKKQKEGKEVATKKTPDKEVKAPTKEAKAPEKESKKKAIPAAEEKSAPEKSAETKKKAPSSKDLLVEKDAFGFRKGTKRSDVIAAIKSGKNSFKEIIEKFSPLTKNQINGIASIAGVELEVSDKGKVSIK